MSTTTAPNENQDRATAAPAAPPLWPKTPSGADLAIEVFGATGDYKRGKTLLGLSIAPGVHPEGHAFAGKPRTLLLDFEKSGGTYGGTGCLRVDVPQKMLALKGGSYSPYDVFAWFLDLIENKLHPGQFDVIAADPITDIESGMVEYVKRHCEKFGLTKNQVEKSGGLLWGTVKDYWKQVLLKLGTLCQCFYFTSHLRQVWQGNSPTGRREPKGKETLMELASLYLWLERKPDKNGKVPDVPAAIVLKERLADTRIDPKTGLLEIVQLMPPRLPQATIAAIRKYIGSPPNYAKLKVGERVPEEEFTEQEKLRLELAKAEAEREAEEARLARVGRQAELQAMARQDAQAKPQTSDRVADRQAAKARADAEQAEIDGLKARAEAGLAETKKLEEKLLAEAPPEHPSPDRPAAAPAVSAGDKATPEQVAAVKSLVVELEVQREKLAAMLRRAGVARVSDLSSQQCQVLIETMERRKAELAKNQ